MKHDDDEMMVCTDLAAVRKLKKQSGMHWADLFELAGYPRDKGSTFSPSNGDTGWRQFNLIKGIAEAAGVPLANLCAPDSKKTRKEVNVEHGRQGGRKPLEARRLKLLQERDAELRVQLQLPAKAVVRETPRAATSQHNKTEHALGQLREALERLEAIHQDEGGAAQWYRELVSLFSDKALTHKEAMTKLRQVKHDADRFNAMRGLLS